MTGSPEEDCVEKMLLNAPSGGYINYSPSIQVSIIAKNVICISGRRSNKATVTLFIVLKQYIFVNNFERRITMNSFDTSQYFFLLVGAMAGGVILHNLILVSLGTQFCVENMN